MLSVPSLVGAGTVVAAATAGLVFGQPAEPNPSRPASNKRKLTSDYENPRLSLHVATSPTAPLTAIERPSLDVSDQPSGPSATSTSRPPRSTMMQITPPKASSRRHSFIRQGDWAHPPISEVSRDSISSNGSWMRRLSIRPLSQHGSPRSSVLLDSPSQTYIHTSTKPAAPPSGTPLPQPRNKLVKRGPTSQDSNNGGTLSRKTSRSQMPTLRRPATSHQRSATLQQFQHPPNTAAAAPAPVPKYSLDQQIRPDVVPTQVDLPEPNREAATKWASFFHSRISKAPSRSTSSRPGEGSPSSYPLPNRRIHLRQGSVPRAYLINTDMMAAPTPTSVPTDGVADAPAEPSSSAAPQEPGVVRSSPEGTPSKRARRSISMHFGSPSNWISRTGSLRRPKRGSETKEGGIRHVSAPVASHDAGHGELRRAVEDIFAPSKLGRDAAMGSMGAGETRTRQRNSSSPLPPLSRLSSFNVDLSRLGASAAPGPKSASAVSGGGFSTSQTFAFPPHSRDVSNERASTLTGSDLEMRGFISGDDDDTDFKSDTMFDSIRTTGSTRLRSVETPLESMFDESPPSTAGNPKTKRLSIQEILGRSWDGDTRIMEEDEGVPTPVRGARSSHGNVGFADDDRDLRDALDYGLPDAGMSLAQRDFGRLSLDDDLDDDWARLDENGVTNNLSPPSSSVNSRGVSPNLRKALASISGNGSPESYHHDGPGDRPRSNVFDWSEPTSVDKSEMDGQSPRPKTAHGKQDLDSRGGRAANRKGPTAAHVRSQSVPVIADLPENKSATKFGTWASGPKNASEEWDDDFDFEAGGPPVSHGKQPAKTLSMVVPASIQATQPSVKAHSGQIRELSLLVNGLKRLCRHGRDLDILGESPALWKEAENIIALASPDEEAEEEAEEDRDSIEFDPATVDERYRDEGFDASTLHSLEDPFESHHSDHSASAAPRDRQTGRRRSVFSPEDDIFGGNWPLSTGNTKPERPQTPDRARPVDAPDTAMIASIMEAMQKQRSSSVPMQASPIRPSKSELFFNTNTLQELVKAANTLFHNLSEIVRRAELITQSPAGTPRHERIRRPEVSPAFTRVFTDPSSPPKRLPKSHSTNSVLSRNSGETPRSGGIGQRRQMMTVG